MMTNKLLVPAALLVTLGLTAPASAGQARTRENHDNHGNRTKVTAQANPRRSAPPAAAKREQPRQVQPRQEQPRVNARREAAPPRSDVRREAASRRVAPRDDRRGYAVPRERDYRRAYRPTYRVVAPYRVYRPHYFARAYFTFRPRLNIGFGFWLGYPVSYPYAYLGTYVPTVYGQVGVARPVSVYGGLSFEVSPYDAAVFVDGEYAGTVGQYPPNAPPLTLTPGPHHVEVQAAGYRPMEWDVTIVPGQVIPWQGAMQPF